MTDNYNKLLTIAQMNNYEGKPVLLSYCSRKKDLEERDENRTIGRELVQNIFKLDMDQVKRICDINKCRCYLTFVGPFILDSLSVFKNNIESFDKWRTTGVFDTIDLHLIDCDNISLESEIINWLEDNGASNIITLPSSKNHSIVFRSTLDIVRRYEKTEFNKINCFHILANINLYVPDFVDNDDND